MINEIQSNYLQNMPISDFLITTGLELIKITKDNPKIDFAFFHGDRYQLEIHFYFDNLYLEFGLEEQDNNQLKINF